LINIFYLHINKVMLVF